MGNIPFSPHLIPLSLGHPQQLFKLTDMKVQMHNINTDL